MKMLQIHSLQDLEPMRVFKNVYIRQPTNPQTRVEGKFFKI
jgi:hypothetical protein